MWESVLWLIDVDRDSHHLPFRQKSTEMLLIVLFKSNISSDNTIQHHHG